MVVAERCQHKNKGYLKGLYCQALVFTNVEFVSTSLSAVSIIQRRR